MHLTEIGDPLVIHYDLSGSHQNFSCQRSHTDARARTPQDLKSQTTRNRSVPFRSNPLGRLHVPPEPELFHFRPRARHDPTLRSIAANGRQDRQVLRRPPWASSSPATTTSPGVTATSSPVCNHTNPSSPLRAFYVLFNRSNVVYSLFLLLFLCLICCATTVVRMLDSITKVMT